MCSPFFIFIASKYVVCSVACIILVVDKISSVLVYSIFSYTKVFFVCVQQTVSF